MSWVGNLFNTMSFTLSPCSCLSIDITGFLPPHSFSFLFLVPSIPERVFIFFNPVIHITVIDTHTQILCYSSIIRYIPSSIFCFILLLMLFCVFLFILGTLFMNENNSFFWMDYIDDNSSLRGLFGT